MGAERFGTDGETEELGDCCYVLVVLYWIRISGVLSLTFLNLYVESTNFDSPGRSKGENLLRADGIYLFRLHRYQFTLLYNLYHHISRLWFVFLFLSLHKHARLTQPPPPGDITPTTLASRIFSFPYDIAGLVLLAFTIAIARETVIETFEASYRHRRSILAARVREKKLERKRRVKERRERRERELREGLRLDGIGIGIGMTVDSGRHGGGEKNEREEGGHYGHVPRGGGIQRELDFVEEREAGVSGGKAWLHRLLRKFHLISPPPALPVSTRRSPRHIGSFNSDIDNSKDETNDLGGLKMQRTITQNSIVQEKGYESFRKQIQKEQSREFQLKIGIAMSLFWIFWLVWFFLS